MLIIVFLIDEVVLNKMTCFQANGSEEESTDVQHTIPDTNSFEVFDSCFILLYDLILLNFFLGFRSS